MRSHLSPLDAAFLEIEEADDAAHMHIGWASIFDPLPGGERPSLERLRAQLKARLDEASILRRRLSMPRVGHLSLPVWLPDPGFDIGQLIRRATLPEPGDEEELMDWLGDYYSHRLDRARPLWEVVLLEGLEGGRWALVTKIHHCLVDGVSGATIAAAMLDAEPEPKANVTTLPELVSSLGTDEERGVLSRLRGSVGEAVSGGIDAALHPRKVISVLSQSRAMVETLVRDELIAAPSTSLNRPVGASRRMAAVDVSMEDLQRIRGELGGTLNDVVLAATAGGLRRLFESRGEDVDHVRAMVPVSLRLREASESLAGNKVSSLFVDLPISEPDTLRRYREICAAASELKKSNQAAGWDGVVKVTGLAPPLVQSVIARLSFTPRLFNLTITNIPASPITLYALGAPMRRAVPLVPIFSGHSVGVAVVSYGGSLTFGLNADRDAMPDLEVLRVGIEDSLTELKDLAGSLPRTV